MDFERELDRLMPQIGAAVLSVGTSRREWNDALQEGRIGAYRAMLTWDPEHGPLDTWVYALARGAAYHWNRDRVRLIRVPSAVQEDAYRIKLSRERLGHEAMEGDVARDTGLSEDRIEFCDQAMHLTAKPLTGRQGSLGSNVSSYRLESETQYIVETALGKGTRDYRWFVMVRLLGYSVEEIARLDHASRKTVYDRLYKADAEVYRFMTQN